MQQGGAVAGPELTAETGKEGRFELVRLHGEGGLGNIWFGRDAELQREVAIKEIKTRFATGENISRFQEDLRGIVDSLVELCRCCRDAGLVEVLQDTAFEIMAILDRSGAKVGRARFNRTVETM